jgi:hypothetical protein
LSKILINDSDLIGKGSNRLVYAFPNDLSRCIKVPKPGKHRHKHQEREVRFYEQLKKNLVPTDHISRYLGTVETNFGTGYIYDAIRDANGQISDKLKTMSLNNRERVPEYLQVMETIEDYLFDNLISFYEVNPSNIVCRINDNGALEPFIVDGLGEKVAIPIVNYSRKLRRLTIRRRWLRQIESMKIRYDWMKDYHVRH